MVPLRVEKEKEKEKEDDLGPLGFVVGEPVSFAEAGDGGFVRWT